MKATQTTIRARVDAVLAVMLDGAMPFQVRQYVAEKEAAGEAPWAIPEGGKPLSERQIRRYCDQADALIAEAVRTNRKKLLRRHVARRQQLYSRAVNAADYRTALAVLDSEARLLDLFPSKDAVPPAAPGVVIIGGVDADAALGRKTDADAPTEP